MAHDAHSEHHVVLASHLPQSLTTWPTLVLQPPFLSSDCHVCLRMVLLDPRDAVLFSEYWCCFGFILEGQEYWEFHKSCVLVYEGMEIVLMDLGLIHEHINKRVGLNPVVCPLLSLWLFLLKLSSQWVYQHCDTWQYLTRLLISLQFFSELSTFKIKTFVAGWGLKL
jgi:hypothetical protein